MGQGSGTFISKLGAPCNNTVLSGECWVNLTPLLSLKGHRLSSGKITITTRIIVIITTNIIAHCFIGGISCNPPNTL